MTDGADSLRGDMRVESGAEGGQVQVAVDAAELLAGLDHAGGAPAQRHVCRSASSSRCVEWVRAMEIIDSMLLVLRSVRASVGGTPQAQHGQRLGQALAQRRGRTGMGALEFFGQGFELGFGEASAESAW